MKARQIIFTAKKEEADLRWTKQKYSTGVKRNSWMMDSCQIKISQFGGGDSARQAQQRMFCNNPGIVESVACCSTSRTIKGAILMLLGDCNERSAARLSLPCASGLCCRYAWAGSRESRNKNKINSFSEQRKNHQRNWNDAQMEEWKPSLSSSLSSSSFDSSPVVALSGSTVG